LSAPGPRAPDGGEASSSGDGGRGQGGLLDRLERLGNALPDPATLFALGAAAVIAASHLAVLLDWSVEKTLSEGGRVVTETLRPVSLLTSDGVYWLLRNMVQAFVEFPPLGVVLVGMLGIGVAERSGLVGAALKAVMLAVPQRLLTPTMVLAGIMSSLGLDAGYVVLPPVAAALYAAVGRPPLAGLAAVFAGVSAGFSANLVPTSIDPMLAAFSTDAAALIDPEVEVAATANWWFMIASTFLLTGVGWAVTARWVEPRLAARAADQGGPVEGAADAAAPLAPRERRALLRAATAVAAFLGLYALAALVPGAPLHGSDGPFPRWVVVIVPMLFLGFLLPGLVYGASTGSVRSDRDVARMMGDTMAAMGGYVVLAFFAAQFIAAFRHSGLGEMLAIAGGRLLASADLPVAGLMTAFVGVVMLGNLFIGSMSAKYAFFAPVFVPMFMQAGIAPELTQVAYRVGDSVTNVITPLNPYMVIILVFVRRYVPSAGLGTVVALMLPFTAAFTVAWILLLVAWITTATPLGPG